MGYSPFLVSVVVCLMVAFGDCMKCPVFREDNDSYPSNAAMTGYVNQCPSAVNHPHDEYCCYDLQFRARCCGLNDFLVNMSVLVVVVLILLMLLATVVSCVCCICCPCCFLYKRRHASGRVYRSEPVPNVTPAEQNTEYTPIHRAHLPPGAYPVLPVTAEIRNLKSHQ